MPRLGRALLWIALALIFPPLFGCSSAVQVSQLLPRNDQGWLEQEVEFRQAVDLLLVLDDGPSMKPKQIAFERGFHALLEAFFSPWHNIDLQVAQVATRAGQRSNPEERCQARPLQLSYLNTPTSNPLDWSCESARITSGGHRIGPGAIQSCLSSFGNQGCGRNAVITNLQEALDTTLASWVRDDAVLALVVLSDERDCSVVDAENLAPDRVDASHELGDLSERCFRLGAQCQGKRGGDYAQCEVRDEALDPSSRAKLISSQAVTDSFFALKDNRYDQVIAMAISGVSDQEESRPQYPLPRQQNSKAPRLGCVQWSPSYDPVLHEGAKVQGAPRWLGAQAPIRLRAIAEETTTPQERALYSICVDDLRRSLHEIATQVLSRVRPVCIFGSLLDKDPESASSAPHCEVIEQGPHGQRVVPECLRNADGSYLVDPSGQGLARPDHAPRCVSYKADAQGDQTLDPYDDMSEQCRMQHARVEVKMYGALVSRQDRRVSWKLRCARSAQ